MTGRPEGPNVTLIKNKCIWSQCVEHFIYIFSYFGGVSHLELKMKTPKERAVLFEIICDERFRGLRSKKKKEWNHFHNNPLNLEGDGKWEKSGRTGNGRRKMKYHRGLNNVGPRGKCSPRAALIAFISIPFMASSLLSRRAIGTPSRWRIPKIDPKLVFATSTFNSPKAFCIFLQRNKEVGRRWRKKLITPSPRGGRVSKTCLQCYTHLISAASGGVTYTHGCSCPRCSGYSINLPDLAWNGPESTALLRKKGSVFSHSRATLWLSCTKNT